MLGITDLKPLRSLQSSPQSSNPQGLFQLRPHTEEQEAETGTRRQVSGWTHSFSYLYRGRGVKEKTGRGGSTSQAQNVTGDGEGKGREAVGRSGYNFCSKRQLACMFSLVKTVQHWAMVVGSRRDGYTGWSQDSI